jgi:signal peptidase I
MAMAYSWAHLTNSRLRAASSTARAHVKEAKKLLKRSKNALSTENQGTVQASISAVAEALGGEDPGAINRATEKLDSLVDKHLGAYRKAAWLESLESIVFAVGVALLLRSFVLEAFKIPSGSMIPSLAIGDQIFVNKYIYGLRIPFTAIRLVEFAKPQRGDVIVFICPVEPHEDYIKRVIGIAGDEVMVRGGTLYINGEAVKREALGETTQWDRDSSGETWRPFAAHAFRETLGEHTYMVLQDLDPSHSAPDFGPYQVPEGHVLMMGDNRDHSYDSRAWGPVPLPNILGRSMFVWWSWGRQGVDVGRIGTWID